MKVLLVDDHALFRAGLALLLHAIRPDARVLEATTLDDAKSLIGQHPDLRLCLLDLALRSEGGIDAITTLRRLAEDMAVVVVSANEEPRTMRACLDAGAMSYVAKSDSPAQLRAALSRVLDGELTVPETLQATVAVAAPQAIGLSPRQRQVLAALGRGMSTKAIARELVLSEHTVKEYVAAVYAALGAHNRTEAVIVASRLGLGPLRNDAR